MSKLPCALVASLLLGGGACTTGPEMPGKPDAGPPKMPCTAFVIGTGMVSVEGDYLPHVIACENGPASFEALKAQAVAARSYLYYRLDRDGMIEDGQSDQVFTCPNKPLQRHYDAVAQTEGLYLRYRDTLVAAFYVAGGFPTDETCTGSFSTDPTSTEKYVTYNEGLAGDNVMQSTLGWVEPTNYANRGCKSQNGAHCLAEGGYLYDDILKFYYGSDIEIIKSSSGCVP